MAAPADAASQWARPLLRAWRDTITNASVLDAQASAALVRHCTRQRAQATFQEWSQSVPARTRKWARLFSKLDFEHNRHAAAPAARAAAPAAPAAPGQGRSQGVAKYFGASNAKELRGVLREYMKDLTADEREEMRFVLHAEAIRRGLGKFSITARRHSW